MPEAALKKKKQQLRCLTSDALFLQAPDYTRGWMMGPEISVAG